jgi:hypothetical protein
MNLIVFYYFSRTLIHMEPGSISRKLNHRTPLIEDYILWFSHRDDNKTSLCVIYEVLNPIKFPSIFYKLIYLLDLKFIKQLSLCHIEEPYHSLGLIDGSNSFQFTSILVMGTLLNFLISLFSHTLVFSSNQRLRWIIVFNQWLGLNHLYPAFPCLYIS